MITVMNNDNRYDFEIVYRVKNIIVVKLKTYILMRLEKCLCHGRR